jgi:hypothetical protein
MVDNRLCRNPPREREITMLQLGSLPERMYFLGHLDHMPVKPELSKPLQLTQSCEHNAVL